MMSPYLPAVLQRKNGNSLSMERALKQVLQHLLVLAHSAPNKESPYYDSLEASIDDVETMLASIN